MLRSLDIQNFKSWVFKEEMRLAPLTGLFGTNSSGKTSILQLLLMLKQTVDSPDRNQVLNFGDKRDPVLLGSFKDIITRHDVKKPLKFKFQWDYPDGYVLYHFSMPKLPFDFPEVEIKKLDFEAEIRLTDRANLSLEYFNYIFNNAIFLMTKSSDTGQDESDVKYNIYSDLVKNSESTRGIEGNLLTEPYGNKNEYKFPSKNFLPKKFYGFPPETRIYPGKDLSFLSDFELSFEKFFASIYYLGPLREYPQRSYLWSGTQPIDMGRQGEKVIDALLACRKNGILINRDSGKQSLEECVSDWLKKLGLVYSFSVEEIKEGTNIYQVLVQKNKNSPRVSLTEVGFGVSQILPVITLCYYVPEGSTIILEQPEIHLHPKAQSELADVFIDAIKHRNIQIILESHSEHLLKRLQRRMAEEKLKPDDVALYFCEISGETSDLTHLNLDEYGNIKNWPKDFFGDEFGEIAAMMDAMIERKRKKACQPESEK